MSSDGLAVLEELCGLTRVRACRPPHVPVPKPGPCPGAKRAAKKALGGKPKAAPKAAPEKKAVPKAQPKKTPAPKTPAPKAAGAKAAATVPVATPAQGYAGPRFEVPTAQREVADRYRASVDKALADGAEPWELDPRYGDFEVDLADQLDDAVRNRVVQEATIAQAAQQFRARFAPEADEEAFRGVLSSRVKAAFANRKIGLRITPQGLLSALKDGRFKTQFETGSSGGSLNLRGRAEVEEQLFGLPKDLPAQQRPVYGYVMGDDQTGTRAGPTWERRDAPPRYELGTDRLSSYGRVQVVLKDSVRARTTAMFGDSLEDTTAALPTPVDSPDWRSFSMFVPQDDEEARHPLAGLRRDVESDAFRAEAYAEAQIHDGVSVEDIERVVLPEQPDRALRAALHKARITWEVRRDGDG